MHPMRASVPCSGMVGVVWLIFDAPAVTLEESVDDRDWSLGGVNYAG